MTVKEIGPYKVVKDGTQFYRVKLYNKRIGSFKLLQQAIDYAHQRLDNDIL